MAKRKTQISDTKGKKKVKFSEENEINEFEDIDENDKLESENESDEMDDINELSDNEDDNENESEEDSDNDDDDDDEDEDEDEDEEDDDDDDNEEGNEIEEEINSKKNKKKEKLSDNSKYYKAPTNEEINQLRETNELFNSNIFKLQIDELLSEVKINKKKTEVLEKTLHKLKSILDNMKEIPEKSISEITKLMKKKNIKIPFLVNKQPAKDIQYKFQFKPPTSVNIVGSYLLQTTCKTPTINNIDLAIELPKSIFQEKDHMNYRYFNKRAYYLAVIASNIQDNKKNFKVRMEFDLLQNDQRQPILVLYGSNDKSEYDFSNSGFCIRILPSISPSVFPIQRLAPTRNNVRPNQEMKSLPPTPQYNNIILTETAYLSHINILHKYVKACAAFKDAIILSKVWLNQRNFNGKTGKLSGFIFSMIMAWLIKTGGPDGSKKLGLNYSSFQLFKITMEFISQHDFINKPIIMTDNQKPISPDFSIESYASTNEIVIIDMTGRVNIASNISKSSMLEIQNEAKLAISNLTGEDSSEKFDTLFLQRINPCFKFDNVLRIPKLSVSPPLYTVTASLDNPSSQAHLSRKLPNLLTKALTNRVKLVCSFNPNTNTKESQYSWKINKEMPEFEQELMIGFILDPANCTKLVDFGPSAEDEEASKEFREIWGEKSELRRFKDGSILESVVWDISNSVNSEYERSLILSRIISHLLERHIGIKTIISINEDESNNVNSNEKDEYAHFWSTQLNSFLLPFETESFSTFKDVMDVYQEFSKVLSEIDSLPLSITSVKPCSPGLRYSSVFVPQPTKNSPALDIVIAFESTTRWPDDLKAIQIMKSALLLELSKVLLRKKVIKDAIINVGNSKRKIEANGYVDFVLTEGYTFRCRIYQEREEVLLKRITEAKGHHAMAQTNEYQECVRALSIINHRFINSPLLSVKIQNLCLRYPSLSYTIRLTKRWISAHLFTKNHISDSIIELICASVYTNPSPWQIPNCGWSGFIHVLHIFANWKWSEEPLIVPIELESIDSEINEKMNKNLYGENKCLNRNEIYQRARKALSNLKETSQKSSTQEKNKEKNNNNIGNNMSQSCEMVIATESDPEGQFWTGRSQDRPTKMIMKRLKHLSKAVLNEIERIMIKGHDAELKKIYVTPKKDFDAIIKLDSSKIPNYKENLYYNKKIAENEMKKKTKYKNIEIDEEDNYEFDQFNPIGYYIYDLKKSFGHICNIFYDQYGGDNIFLLWNKKAVSDVPQKWKINTKYSSMPIDNDYEQFKPNLNGILGEMQRLGEGFVKGIVINNSNQ